MRAYTEKFYNKIYADICDLERQHIDKSKEFIFSILAKKYDRSNSTIRQIYYSFARTTHQPDGDSSDTLDGIDLIELAYSNPTAQQQTLFDDGYIPIEYGTVMLNF